MSTTYYYGAAGGNGPLPAPSRYSPYNMDVIQPNNPQYSQETDAPQWTTFQNGASDDSLPTSGGSQWNGYTAYAQPETAQPSGGMSYGDGQTKSATYLIHDLQNQLTVAVGIMNQLNSTVESNDAKLTATETRLNQLEKVLEQMAPLLNEVVSMTRHTRG